MTIYKFQFACSLIAFFVTYYTLVKFVIETVETADSVPSTHEELLRHAKNLTELANQRLNVKEYEAVEKHLLDYLQLIKNAKNSETEERLYEYDPLDPLKFPTFDVTHVHFITESLGRLPTFFLTDNSPAFHDGLQFSSAAHFHNERKHVLIPVKSTIDPNFGYSGPDCSCGTKKLAVLRTEMERVGDRILALPPRFYCPDLLKNVTSFQTVFVELVYFESQSIKQYFYEPRKIVLTSPEGEDDQIWTFSEKYKGQNVSDFIPILDEDDEIQKLSHSDISARILLIMYLMIDLL